MKYFPLLRAILRPLLGDGTGAIKIKGGNRKYIAIATRKCPIGRGEATGASF
jgi:hypothetical protein